MREPVQTQTEDLADSHWANSVLPATGTLVIPQSPAFLNIKCSYLKALQSLGYTESEARSLYIVATHSGYFGARFCAFAYSIPSLLVVARLWRNWLESATVQLLRRGTLAAKNLRNGATFLYVPIPTT